MLGFIEDFRRGYARALAQHSVAPRPPVGSPAERDTLAELLELSETLQARVDELEAERDALPATLLGEVLSLPGVKMVLLKAFHPDKHPRATVDELKAFADAITKINAAYEAIERGASS